MDQIRFSGDGGELWQLKGGYHLRVYPATKYKENFKKERACR
jgi:hypothetical protein